MSIASFVPIAGLLKVWDLLYPKTSVSGGSDELASFVNIIFFIGLNISIIVGSRLTLRRIDKRPYVLLGLDFILGAVKDFAKGFLLGFLNFVIIFFTLWIAGLIEIELSVMNYMLFTGIIKYFIVFTVAAVLKRL